MVAHHCMDTTDFSCTVPFIIFNILNQKPDGSFKNLLFIRASVSRINLRWWMMHLQVNDANTMVGTPGELLSRRCVALLKTALKPDVWPQQCDLKLNWFDKVFASVESGSPNYGNICTALELLTFLLGVMKKEQILASCKPLQRGIAACITCSNSKVRDVKTKATHDTAVCHDYNWMS